MQCTTCEKKSDWSEMAKAKDTCIQSFVCADALANVLTNKDVALNDEKYKC